MRFWALSSPEIAAADAEPWDGRLAALTRPVTMRVIVLISALGVLLSLQAGGFALFFGTVLSDDVARPAALLVTGAAALICGLAILVFMAALPARTARRSTPVLALVVIPSMGIVTTLGIWGSGPSFGIAAVFYLEALPFAFYLLRLRWALVVAANALAGFALVLIVQEGWPAPAAQWCLVASTVVAVAWATGRFAERADRLAEAEHEARVQLAEVNRTLEERVAAQVGEIERLGQLRRFLTPQVADAVLSEDAEEVTRPHRRRIAVFFCDLRGFTAFTRESEPEDVIANLDQYYRTAGEVLQRHGATIGGYAGDGIMAYFGDPVPHSDAAGAAVHMVMDLREPMDALVADWQRRGHDLGYGMGLAFGYATLGVVGFDGRYDYTPLGGVVNLAARLCGAAGPGEVLLDHATYVELDGVVCREVDAVELKGLGARRAYALLD